jgi:hypothetical protein
MLFVLAIALAFANAQAKDLVSEAPKIGCIPWQQLECGCSIRIANLGCADPATTHPVHLFTALHADAPLLIYLNDIKMRVPHVQHIGDSEKGNSPMRASDVYVSDDLHIRIDYAPATSTCHKQDDDGCEYTDVSAKVTLQMTGEKARTYTGIGKCGC